MTETEVAAALKVSPSSSPSDDSIFDFTITDWVAPSLLVAHKAETSAALKRRQQAEHVYRSKTTPTHWFRYLTLGRHAMSGADFDTLMEDQEVDELKVHCVIWYNFSFHVDRDMECSPQLQAWALKKSKPYLTQHQSNALLVDTIATTWRLYAKQQSLSDNWAQVKQKNKKASKKQTLLTPFVSAAKHRSTSTPSTIDEEKSNESGSEKATSKQSSIPADTASVTSDGKQSVLMASSNIPVCDGTHRVTIRWKLPLEVNRISRQAAEMKEAISSMLKELFRDDDGYLYQWTDDGTNKFMVISKMTSTEIRQFICPSLTIIPSQSLAIIPLRFGFSGKNPSNWRNSENTRATLARYNASASISNSTSTSGDLVISGYILLKAPMTTHRLRYLQSLRMQLPDSTPPFDMLLHKRSPTDELIPHLVVQCGEKHVHTLSEALMSILTGNNSPVFIPRSALIQMPVPEVTELFQTHDNYVKSLQWLPLSPLLSNLDKPRNETYPDGSIIERTTREWARNIKTIDGKEYARCDVVNGGTDQLSYLLFPPQSGAAANAALEQYRKLINPFKQREERYREKVGPVSGPQFSHKVIANLDFMKKLSSDMSVQSQKSTSSSQNKSSSSQASTSTASSASEPSQVSHHRSPSHPANSPAPAPDNTDSDTVDTDMSETSRSTSPSKLSSDRMSTTSARFREIDKLLNIQKQAYAKQEQLSSDRLSMIERQLHRINDMDGKLDSVQQDFSTRLDEFEGKVLTSMKSQIDASGAALENMNAKLEKLMLVVETVVTADVNKFPHGTEGFIDSKQRAESVGPALSSESSQRTQPHHHPVTAQMKTEATIAISSPVKKRVRSAAKQGRKRNLNEATRAALDSLQHNSPARRLVNDQEITTMTEHVISTPPRAISSVSSSLSNVFDDKLQTPRSPTPPSPMEHQATDYESQYTEKSCNDDHHQSRSNADPSSHSRGAKH